MINYLYAHLYILFTVVPVQHSPNRSQEQDLKIDDGQSLTSKMVHVTESGVSRASPAMVQFVQEIS